MVLFRRRIPATGIVHASNDGAVRACWSPWQRMVTGQGGLPLGIGGGNAFPGHGDDAIFLDVLRPIKLHILKIEERNLGEGY